MLFWKKVSRGLRGTKVYFKVFLSSNLKGFYRPNIYVSSNITDKEFYFSLGNKQR